MASAQQFLANLTEKAAADLETALLRIPEDKRDWSPMGGARTVLDQAAECALLNGATAELLAAKKWEGDDFFAAYENNKAELSQNSEEVRRLLKENGARVAAAIRATGDDDLAIVVTMPWGPMTLGQIIGYPLWNMSYHEGQINYVASMLGSPD